MDSMDETSRADNPSASEHKLSGPADSSGGRIDRILSWALRLAVLLGGAGGLASFLDYFFG